MSKYKVGDKFNLVYSESNTQSLNVDTVHTLVSVIPLTETNKTQFYATDTGWYLEEGYTDNELLVEGISYILAVLIKIEEPDT